MLRLFYNRNRAFNKLFWFFWNYFQDASMPTTENLFLLVISMLALESFRSIRFAWGHIIPKLTDKSLNSFYYTLGYAVFDHLKWMAVTARLALGCRPLSLMNSAVFLSIDDTCLQKPEGAPYHMGCRKVITNLWKGRTVYVCVTATDPKKPTVSVCSCVRQNWKG